MDGAIYTVYLKKVRYNTPSRSLSEDDEDSISHLEWETVRVRFVKVKLRGKKMLRLRTSISGWDDGEAGGVPSKRHRGVGVDLHQCFSSHLQNVRVGQTSPKFADGKVRNYELGTHGSWEEFHEY